MIKAILNINLNSKVKVYSAAFFLVLPILFQLLLVSRSRMFISDIDRWTELKVSIIILYACWFLISIGFIFLLRVKLIYLSIPIFISLVVAAYILVTGENIEYEVYASINNTSLSEAIEFVLSSFFLPPFILVLVMFIIIYHYILNEKKDADKKYIVNYKYSIVFLFVGGAGLLWSYYYSRDALYKTFPLSIPFYQKMYYKESILFRTNYIRINYNFNGILDLAKNSDEIYILVIGETARKQSMSIYGYSVNTTPELEKALTDKKLKSVIYNSTSAGISTRLAIPLLISTADTINYKNLSSTPTLAHVFNNVGFSTALISNQEKSGRNNDTITLMLNNMKSREYISGDTGEREYDIKLLPALEKTINTTDGKIFIILHLMGSHWDYGKRYPKEFSIYKDERVGIYDNSIRYTDYVLGKIIEVVKNSEKPISLIYTSDHGENLNDAGDGNYLHAAKEMTEYEVMVPFFITFNEEFYKLKKEKVERVLKNRILNVSHDNISHTFLGLAGIYDKNVYRSRKDLSSTDFDFSVRRAVNRRLEIVDVDKYLKALK